LLTDLTQFPDFSRAFVNLCSEDSQFDAWSWICGERLESRFRRRLGLTANLSNHDAMRATVAVVRILHSQKVSPLVMLLDEFETIETLPVRQKQEILFNLRWLMDQCPHGLVLVLACAPEIWAEIASQYHAFSARIGAQVELRPLKLSEVRGLISRYLLTVRVDRRDRPVMSEGFIRHVFQESDGNIRRILMLCHDGLESAALSGSRVVEERHLPEWID
jgi:type II secretory pathway predicted ATPase ExeA